MTMRMRFVLMAAMALIMRVTAFQGKIGCDDDLTVYLDGAEVASDTIWNQVNDISLADTPTVIAAKCVNLGGQGGLVGSFDDGVVTDTSWLCSGTASPGWTEASFNDSTWAAAVLTDNAPGLGNYGGVSASAKFIWSNIQSTEATFCRKTLEPEPVTPDGCTYKGVVHPANETWLVHDQVHSGLHGQSKCTCPYPVPETWSAESCIAACAVHGNVVYYVGEPYYINMFGSTWLCKCTSFDQQQCTR